MRPSPTVLLALNSLAAIVGSQQSGSANDGFDPRQFFSAPALDPYLRPLMIAVIVAIGLVLLALAAHIIALCLPDRREQRERSRPPAPANDPPTNEEVRAPARSLPSTTPPTTSGVFQVKTQAVIAAILFTALTLEAQTPPVRVPATRAMRLTAADADGTGDVTGSPGGKLIYYTMSNELRVYNRTNNATSVVMKGAVNYVASSMSGDRLVLLRPTEGAKPGPNRDAQVWTLSVNAQTGAATGEPRRVSMSSAQTPRISPDGRSIAFIALGQPNKLVVIPVSGGPERVVLSSVVSNGPVRWSPDSKWIYISQPSEPKGMDVVARVPVDGGTPTVVTPPLFLAEPGVTPDGRYLVGATRGSIEKPVLGIFDHDKKQVASVEITNLPRGEPGVFAWSGDGMHLLIAMWEAEFVVATRDIDGGNARTLPLGGRFAGAPVLSPDGKRVALFVSGDTTIWEFVIMNADGSGRRSLPQNVNEDMVESVWSPDSKYVAFKADGRRSLYVADAATAKAVKVGSGEITISGVRWRADSRAVMYTRQDGVQGKTRESIHEATVTGQDRLVRDFTSLLPPTGEAWQGAGAFAGDSAVFVFRAGVFVPLSGGSARKVYEPGTSFGPTSVSRGGKWIALTAVDRKSVDILSTDGGARRTVSFPAPSARGLSVLFHPDGNSLIMVTEPVASTAAALYRVPLDGSAARAVFTLAAGESFSSGSLSQDGRTVLYSKFSAPVPSVLDIDVGAALRSPQRR